MELEQAMARIAELEAALQPFCDAFGEMGADDMNDDRVFVTSPNVFQEMTVRDFRMAAAVLKPEWYQEGGE